MARVIKIRDTDDFKNGQGAAVAEKKAKRDAKAQARVDFEGKVFADLNPPEKDNLLKVLAIEAGLIEE